MTYRPNAGLSVPLLTSATTLSGVNFGTSLITLNIAGIDYQYPLALAINSQEITINALSAATSLLSTDQIPAYSGGATVAATITQIAAAVAAINNGGLTLGQNQVRRGGKTAPVEAAVTFGTPSKAVFPAVKEGKR